MVCCVRRRRQRYRSVFGSPDSSEATFVPLSMLPKLRDHADTGPRILNEVRIGRVSLDDTRLRAFWGNAPSGGLNPLSSLVQHRRTAPCQPSLPPFPKRHTACASPTRTHLNLGKEASATEPYMHSHMLLFYQHKIERR